MKWKLTPPPPKKKRRKKEEEEEDSFKLSLVQQVDHIPQIFVARVHDSFEQVVATTIHLE